jgi:DNA-binding PadR family transcriptional regulator
MALPADHLPLAPVAFEVLLSLSRGPQHGYGMIQEIAARSEGTIQLATSSLYATIRRLEDAGLVEDVGSPGADSGGPARRYYRLTRMGARVARLEAERLQKVARTARRWLLDTDQAGTS